MLREKENVAATRDVLVNLLEEMRLQSTESLTHKKALLQEFYLEWLENVGTECTQERRLEARNLFTFISKQIELQHEIATFSNDQWKLNDLLYQVRNLESAMQFLYEDDLKNNWRRKAHAHLQALGAYKMVKNLIYKLLNTPVR